MDSWLPWAFTRLQSRCWLRPGLSEAQLQDEPPRRLTPRLQTGPPGLCLPDLYMERPEGGSQRGCRHSDGSRREQGRTAVSWKS